MARNHGKELYCNSEASNYNAKSEYEHSLRASDARRLSKKKEKEIIKEMEAALKQKEEDEAASQRAAERLFEANERDNKYNASKYISEREAFLCPYPGCAQEVYGEDRFHDHQRHHLKTNYEKKNHKFCERCHVVKYDVGKLKGKHTCN